ncbi:MAG: ADP-ribosylglycohydrolase family protein, partial [Magnetococcus sp. WYHC-3]
GIVHYRNKGSTEVPPDEYDAGNGACMRTLPLALLTLDWDQSARQAASRAQAHITHNNPLSDAGTECVVELVRHAVLGEPLVTLVRTMADLVARHPEFRYQRKQMTQNPSGYIVDTLRVVFQGVYFNDSFESLLVDVVNRGGDADTTGAIAGMIAGGYYGPGAIPREWVRKLDPQVRRRCVDQALALVRMGGRA